MSTKYAALTLLSWVLCCSIGMASTVHARVWHVFADSTGDAPFLAAAIDSAQDGDTIELGVGDFPVSDVRIEQKSLSFLGQGPEATRIIGGLYATDAESLTVSSVWMAAGADGTGITTWMIDHVVMDDCTFTDGIYTNEMSQSQSTSVINCRFLRYRSKSILGGGALTILGGKAEIIDCVFDGNYSPNGTPGKGWGGGGLHLQVDFEGEALVMGCVFSNNEAASGGGAFCGGLKSSIRVINNTFVGNMSQDGALYAWGGVSEVYGNIFVANEGFGLWYDSIAAACNCNIYWANRQDPQGHQAFGACFFPEGGSQVIDPELCDRRMGDYHIATTSPALPENYPQGFIDAGCSGVIGALGIGCDRVPTIDTSWGSIKRQFLPEASSARTDDGHH